MRSNIETKSGSTKRISGRLLAARYAAIVLAVGLLEASWSVLRGFTASTTMVLADDEVDVESLAGLLELLIDVDPDSAQKSIGVISAKIQQHELDAKVRESLKQRLEEPLARVLKAERRDRLYAHAVALSATLGHAEAQATCRSLVVQHDLPDQDRLAAVRALIYGNDARLAELLPRVFEQAAGKELEFRGHLLDSLGRWDNPALATELLSRYDAIDPTLQPHVIELLTQRPAWTKTLLAAIQQKKISATVLNANQVAKLQSSKDAELVRMVREQWGTVRTERNPQRDQVIAQIRKRLQTEQGNPEQGIAVFNKLCGQCHRIHGRGQEVGPDITLNGRASFEQLLSNVLDPSLVIGTSYQGRILVTDEGRVLTGLPVEESPQRVVLKMQGGELATVPRDEIDSYKVSELSLMPEGIEKQLTDKELLDLFAFLLLDKPPQDPEARFIPGTPAVQAQGP